MQRGWSPRRQQLLACRWLIPDKLWQLLHSYSVRQSHSYFQSGSLGCLMSQRGRRLLTVGISAKLYSGGGELVAHSSVQASQGSFPAGGPLRAERSRLKTK